jgi:HK97 family phage portal protein
MTWIERIASRLGYVPEAKAKAQRDEVSAKIMALISTAGAGAGFGSALTTSEKSYSQLVDAYRSWVYTSIDRVAKSVATLKLKLVVYRARGSRDKVLLPGTVRAELKVLGSAAERRKFLEEKNLVREEITDHPWLELIGRPNPVMTRFLLWYETILRMELSGSCGWYLPQNRLGLPGEIWPLPLTKGATLTPKVTAVARIESWLYRDGDVRNVIAPQDLLFHRYPHPGSPFKGMSPLMAQTYPYDIDLYLMQRQKALFENAAVPSLNLHTGQNLSPDQAKELKEFVDMQLKGVHRFGESLVTHSGLEAKSVGMSNKDAAFEMVAKDVRERLISSYDLSEGKLGLVSDVNRANMEALDRTFNRDCLLPKTMLLEEGIEAWMLPRYDEGLSCDFDLPDLDDKELALREREINLKNLVTAPDEERAKMGLDPAPWGKVPWIPAGQVQFGAEPPPPAKSHPRSRRPGNGADRGEDDDDTEGHMPDLLGWEEEESPSH